MTIKSWMQKVFSAQPMENQVAYVHDLLERLAQGAEAEAIAKRDAIFLKAIAEHKKDVTGFHFECDRIGDFLNIKIARMGNPKEPKDNFFYIERPDQVFATAINLKSVGTIQFFAGGAPDTNGELTYGYWLPSDKMDGSGGLGGTNFGNFLPRLGHHWEVRPNYPHIPYSRPLFIIKAARCREENTIAVYSRNYEIKFSTANYPRAARDDRIIFEGIAATLFVPAGLGEDVFKRCLRAQSAI